MLFNEQGSRVFNAIQTNGESRKVEYTIDGGVVVIIAVDGLNVYEYPLHVGFEAVVLNWIDEHIVSLKSHAGFEDGNILVTCKSRKERLGLCRNQHLDVSNTLAA